MRIQTEADFFDSFQSRHGNYDVFTEAGYHRLLSLFVSMVKPSVSERCADLGCGTGAFTSRLSCLGLQTTGIDVSINSLHQAAQSRVGKEKYIGSDVCNLGISDNSFDIITYSAILHHLNSPALRISALSEGYRVLKPGGHLFAFDPSIHSPSMWLYRHPRSPFYSGIGKTSNEVLLSRDELNSELQSSGFENIRVIGVAGIKFRYVESRIARKLLPLYNLYETILRISPFEQRLGTFLVSVATKQKRHLPLLA